jgi:hypothetical protein
MCLSVHLEASEILKTRQASGTSKSGPRDTMNACKFMASALLILCNDKDKENLKDREGNIPLISMKKSYSTLFKTAPSELIIPLQESLTANVLLVSGNNRQYNPFPVNVPKFLGEFARLVGQDSQAHSGSMGGRGRDHEIVGQAEETCHQGY